MDDLADLQDGIADLLVQLTDTDLDLDLDGLWTDPGDLLEISLADGEDPGGITALYDLPPAAELDPFLASIEDPETSWLPPILLPAPEFDQDS
ncbi:hypothetical protein F4553_001349 [Allocatelliglobosispora scoriae]|uniref:Uncharacterized protein n=1 Tax=Allocatelliglobosispora scoriae TaxID=643052 RepID=A0A841BMC1_9ACTN|nr:hypothetical protein [Allocatelliglobosispora scoriae]MBB5867970.1 hypothetical protein [Allocatelliglobosispora scoriae]